MQKYGIESYIAVPLSRLDGSYFGTLCALDPRPAHLNESSFTIFELMAQLIAYELEAEDDRIARETQIGSLNDVISIAAHDLRQPLTALLLRSQMTVRQANKETVSPQLTERLQEQVAGIRRTISLTDKLLDVSRLEANSFSLDLAEVDLAELVAQVVDDIKSTTPDHQFEVQLPSSLKIRGDAIRLNQVVRNLLDNAVKYSPYSKEPITVSLTVVPTVTNLLAGTATGANAAETKWLAVVRIEDHGLGVKESDLNHLFERQFRTQEAKEAGIGGSGFGLYISRQLIKAHGGRIWAEEVNGGGLAVSFSLPSETPL